MAIRLCKENDHVQYGTTDFTADTAADISSLPTNITPGSECFCINSSETYILNTQGSWEKKKQGSGGGSGGGGGTSYPSADGRSFPLYNDDVTLLTQSQYYNDIAKAINEKYGEDNSYLPSQMATAIENIPSGGMTLTEWQKLQTRRKDGMADDSNNFSRLIWRSRDLETYSWGRSTYNKQGDWYLKYEFLNRTNHLNLYIRPDSESKIRIEYNTSQIKNWTTWNGDSGQFGYDAYPFNCYVTSRENSPMLQFLNLSENSHPYLKQNFINEDTVVDTYDLYTLAKFKDFFKINLPQVDYDGIFVYYSSYYAKYFVIVSMNEADRPTIANDGRIYLNPPLGIGEVQFNYYNNCPTINVEILQQSWGYLNDVSTCIIFNTFDIKRTGSDEVVLTANCTKSDLI